LDIGDFIGSRNGFQSQLAKSLFILWFDGLAKALKPLPVVKTDADGKT
jgi:lysyl-tRNA synthetase class 2